MQAFCMSFSASGTTATADVNEDGVWSAQRLTGAAKPITADTGYELRPLVAQDAIQWNREVFARNNT